MHDTTCVLIISVHVISSDLLFTLAQGSQMNTCTRLFFFFLYLMLDVMLDLYQHHTEWWSVGCGEIECMGVLRGRVRCGGVGCCVIGHGGMLWRGVGWGVYYTCTASPAIHNRLSWDLLSNDFAVYCFYSYLINRFITCEIYGCDAH